MGHYGVRWDGAPHETVQKMAEERALKPGRTWGLGFLYRFEDHSYATRIDPFDDSDDNWTTVTHLELTAFLIRSVTPCGWTIEANNGLGWRFINKSARKIYALPTIEAALASFIARKHKQASIYEARAQKARRMIEIAKGDNLW
jgi:hypothetical protein